MFVLNMVISDIRSLINEVFSDQCHIIHTNINCCFINIARIYKVHLQCMQQFTYTETLIPSREKCDICIVNNKWITCFTIANICITHSKDNEVLKDPFCDPQPHPLPFFSKKVENFNISRNLQVHNVCVQNISCKFNCLVK